MNINPPLSKDELETIIKQMEKRDADYEEAMRIVNERGMARDKNGKRIPFAEVIRQGSRMLLKDSSYLSAIRARGPRGSD